MSEETTEASLRAAILAAPEDLGPRLALADWLCDRKDPLGDFLRVQCALAGVKDPQSRKGLRLREANLRNANERAWTAPLRKFTTERAFHLGLLGHVGGTTKKLLPELPGIFAKEPVRSLTLLGVAGAKGVQELLATGLVRRLKRLKLTGPIGDEGVRALVSSDEVSGLESLVLTRVGMTAKGAALLASARTLRGLKVLALGGNALGDDGVRALTDAKSALQVQTLYLTDTGLTNAGLQALCRSELMKGLGLLTLTRTKVDDAGVEALAEAPEASGLRHLELSGTGLTLRGARALAASKYLSDLARLDIHGTPALRGKGLALLKERFPRALRASR
ncbi:MAG: TIGR02996 domain-containing protein [Deltaproteobacteria bacterium]|nr:TIGR02996 domain-containing protein [Deltaproteobacteria bacterium]